jgi:hypothetical protein
MMRIWRRRNSTSLAKRFYIDMFISGDILQSVLKGSVCDELRDIIDVYHMLLSSGMVEGLRRTMADSGGP